MKDRLRHKFLRRLQLRESWIIFFIMGIIMMNFPFIYIFNKPSIILGFPLMFLYLFIGWPISIFVIYLFTLAVSQPDNKHQEKRQP
jgi:hypothetical protein